VSESAAESDAEGKPKTTPRFDQSDSKREKKTKAQPGTITILKRAKVSPRLKWGKGILKEEEGMSKRLQLASTQRRRWGEGINE